MPNTYFRFKQFTVQQDRSVMKVCTDSCILGAWTASRLHGVKTILDIGSGTGLLPLMLAQKSLAHIDSIESDAESFIQAEENIKESPWFNRIRIIEGDVRYYSFESTYDFIITNPPFYESDLQSPVHKKNKAKHEESLTLDDLMKVIRTCLNDDGFFSILLPFHRTSYFLKLAAENDFFLHEKITIKQTPRHDAFRTICLFGYKKPEHTIPGDLTVKDAEGKNSFQFAELMKDFYENG
jgi:tRNA1Val (adenine37-N6)-methyltransferase